MPNRDARGNHDPLAVRGWRDVLFRKAADAGQPVCMSHLLRGARGEYAKLEKPLTDAEIGGWV